MQGKHFGKEVLFKSSLIVFIGLARRRQGYGGHKPRNRFAILRLMRL